jgi:hypothetical protein
MGEEYFGFAFWAVVVDDLVLAVAFRGHFHVAFRA